MRHLLLLSLLYAGLLRAQGSLEVVAAYYGPGPNFIDVTDVVRPLAQPDGLRLMVGVASLGNDPFPGQVKLLRLYYRYLGQFQAGEWKDGELVLVGRAAVNRRDGGMRGDRAITPTKTSSKLIIVSAQYGAGTRVNDVTALLAGRIANNRLSVVANNDTLGGDPARATAKTLTVAYEINGQRATATVKEGQTLTLPPEDAAAGPTTPANGACFYPAANFGGQPVCAAQGQDQAQVSGPFASLKLLGTTRLVEIFESQNFTGRTLRLSADTADLSRVTSGFFGTPATWAPNFGSFRMSQ
ncbi:MAG: hypothetical protein K2X03_04595 [Bryobacteraceae bacterium]|nr:hypothetical protein [Bryobacteraceae bacterium]